MLNIHPNPIFMLNIYTILMLCATQSDSYGDWDSMMCVTRIESTLDIHYSHVVASWGFEPGIYSITLAVLQTPEDRQGSLCSVYTRQSNLKA